MSEAMLPNELRLTLLWHFGTTDPEVIHEIQDKNETNYPSYADMLKKAAGVESKWAEIEAKSP